MASNNDLRQAEQRRDARDVFDHFQTGLAKNASDLRNLQEQATGPRFRSVSRTVSSFTSSNAEQTLVNETLQAGALQNSNIIEFEVVGLSLNNSGGADNVTYRFRYGGSAVTLGTISLPASAQPRLFRAKGWLYGDGAPNMQKFVAHIEITGPELSFGTGLISAFARASLAIDSTAQQAILFTAQHATSNSGIGSTRLLYKLGAPIVST